VICSRQEKDILTLFDDELLSLDAEARSHLHIIMDQADQIQAGLIHPFLDASNINLPDAYGNTPLILACSRNARPDLVQLLIQKNANPDVANKDGWTPLIMAAHAGRFEVVQLLLERGAHVNAANRFGETAILKAVYNNDVPMVELLLTHGADINKANRQGDTPLSVATKREHAEILSIFRKLRE
jgi:ankyrin repeat protein